MNKLCKINASTICEITEENIKTQLIIIKHDFIILAVMMTAVLNIVFILL